MIAQITCLHIGYLPIFGHYLRERGSSGSDARFPCAFNGWDAFDVITVIVDTIILLKKEKTDQRKCYTTEHKSFYFLFLYHPGTIEHNIITTHSP